MDKLITTDFHLSYCLSANKLKASLLLSTLNLLCLWRAAPEMRAFFDLTFSSPLWSFMFIYRNVSAHMEVRNRQVFYLRHHRRCLISVQSHPWAAVCRLPLRLGDTAGCLLELCGNLTWNAQCEMVRIPTACSHISDLHGSRVWMWACGWSGRQGDHVWPQGRCRFFFLRLVNGRWSLKHLLELSKQLLHL